MKFSNSATALGTLAAILLVFFVGTSSAAGCTQYGHSCWGGHGKRGIPDRVQLQHHQQQQPLDENWFVNKLRRGAQLRELGLMFNRPIDSKDIEIMKQISDAKENFENENDRSAAFNRANPIESEMNDERATNEESIDDMLFLTDNAATPEKINLIKLLKNNISSRK